MKVIGSQAEQRFSKIYPPHYIKAVDAILAMPSGPKRWRASAALVMNLNPIAPDGRSARQEHLDIVAANRETRAEQANVYASSVKYQTETDGTYKEGFLRFGLSMPQVVLQFIEMFDMPAFDPKNPDCKKNLHKLMREFPEYCIPEKI